MNGKLLERCFVNLIDAMIEEGKIAYPSRSSFAEAAFPGGENPTKIWQNIRKGQKGKPRDVSISEAYSMARACGENLDRLLVKAEVMIEQGWTLEQDIFNQEGSSKPGRPRKADGIGGREKRATSLKGEEAKELSTGTDA